MSLWTTEICHACLNDNRTLYPLCELQHIIKELKFLQKSRIRKICWECRRMIIKLQQFKNQVLKAQNILNHNSEIKYMGRLSTVYKNEFDYKFDYDFDPLIYTDSSFKNELQCKIKDEQENIIEDKCGLINTLSGDCLLFSAKDVKIDGKVNKLGLTEYLTVRDQKDVKDGNDKVLRIPNSKVRKKRSSEMTENDFNGKFTTVIFSEEEMMKSREEKRNQPNFKKIPYKCDSCVLGFTKRETYNLHYGRKHDESIGPYTCKVCAVRFVSPRAMEIHRQRHYCCYRCKLCKYETLQLGSALAHCNTKHACDRAGEIHCQQCGFIAGTPGVLADHERDQHTLRCNECGEKFKGKDTLRTHKIRIHTSNRNYICDVCSKSFKTKSRLESHLVAHNATLAQKLSYCSACDVQYKNIYVYRNHLKNSVNHSERLYHCLDCNKKFASKKYWQKHCDFYHLKKSQFKCAVCNKLLISEWKLKSHMQTRHGSSRTRDHVCNECGKKFFTISTLRSHQLTHSAQRSYMCEQCGDTFKQRAALYTHTRALHAHTRILVGP